jgi:hypothetical protein
LCGSGLAKRVLQEAGRLHSYAPSNDTAQILHSGILSLAFYSVKKYFELRDSFGTRG